MKKLGPHIRYMLFCLSFLFGFIGVALAQIPNYYNGINFEEDSQYIHEELTYLLTVSHTTVLPYTHAYFTDVWDALRMTDKDPDVAGNLLLIYGYDDNDSNPLTDRTRHNGLSCHRPDCDDGLWNREHVYPRSLGTPNLGFENAGSDVHAIRAIDAAMNEWRSNRRFADAQGDTQITSQGGFYPGDEWKGDVARMIMYMYVRYPSQCKAYRVGMGPSTYAPNGDMPDIFLQWNADDPVTDEERERNDIIFGLQGNRNPFIDNPALATKIWGGPITEDTWSILNVESHKEINYEFVPSITNTKTCIQEQASPNTTYSLYQINGNLIDSGSLDQCIDFSSYQSGIYIIHLNQNQANKAYKIIVP